MYLSLKKKIFYIVFALFVIMATLFLSIFILIYAEKYSSDFDSVSKRNQYVMSLLHDNITMQRKLNDIHIKVSPVMDDDLSAKQRELSQEARINEELQRNFNEQSKAFFDGMKIIGVSSMLSLISVLGLGLMLQRWVIVPINKLTEATQKISKGDFSYRISAKPKQFFFDEFDALASTFNSMISSIERNVAEIKNSERFLQALIDGIPDGIRVIDQNCNVVMHNNAYQKQFSSEGQKLKCYEAYGFDKVCPAGMFSCPLKELKSEKSSSISMIQNVSGRPLSVNAAPLKVLNSENESNFYIIESIRDLSDDIRFSHQQKIASLGFLATSVAHEMKNNLGSTRMILEALLENTGQNKVLSPQDIKYLRMVYDQIVASVEIPERLLNLARNDPEKKEVFDLKDKVDDVLSLLDYEAKRNGVKITTQYKTSENKILGNTTDFKMIVLNLVQNAIKAMPSGGKLLISSNKNKNDVILKIQDTGTGIPSDKLPHIFDPFYSQGQASRAQGTGLGLAIVKSLVDKYRGKIEVSSIVGKGTTFEIRFPKAKS